MQPKTNRLLMLLVGAVISGCATQTDRSSSGGGAQSQAEPEKESVQFVDRPLDDSPPPKPPAVAVAPKAAPPKDETTPDFPVTKYELPEDQAKDEEVEDLGPQEDESESAEQEAAPEEESSVGETTDYADEQEADSGEVEDLGTQPDDSETVSFPEEKHASADSVVSEPKVYPDEPAPKAVAAAPKVMTVNFETEPLFNFDKSTVRADQRAKLDELVSSLGGTQYDSIPVLGHADRIGKDAYNQRLSERRAAAVKAYLMEKGISADKIQAEGRGKSESVTGDACNKIRGKALISCLQPDRRVDVSVSAIKQAN